MLFQTMETHRFYMAYLKWLNMVGLATIEWIQDVAKPYLGNSGDERTDG